MDEDWLKERLEKIQKEREENSKYQQLKSGENIIRIDLTQLPIEQEGKYGKRYIYQTLMEKNGKKLLLSASPILDALIIKALSNGLNPFTIVKAGTGLNTRYSVKELDSPNGD